MKKGPKEPTTPAALHDTARHQMLPLLAEREWSAKELSSEIGIPEKEVYGHLEHIKKSLSKALNRFVVIPAACRKCGFVFSKRERLKKPGRCPVCRSEAIREPRFMIEQ